MTVTRYDLLGLAAVDSHDTIPTVAHELSARLGHFASMAEGRAPEVEMCPLANSSMPGGLAPDHLLSRRKFTLTELDGLPAAVIPFRSHPDIVIVFTDPLTVLYSPRPGVAGKLVDALIYCLQLVLLRKGATLFHGAALTRGDESLVLTGLQGSRKTLVLLTLLRQGWNFMADDRLIVYGGKMQLFSDRIPLMPHHFAVLPWLQDQGKVAARFAPKARRMVALGSWCEQYLPSYLLPRLISYYDKPLMVHPDELFDQCQTTYSAALGDIIMLVGGQCRKRMLSVSEASAPLSIICDVEFFPYVRMEHELAVRGIHIRPPTAPILEHELAEANIMRIGISEEMTVEETTDEVLKCIRHR